MKPLTPETYRAVLFDLDGTLLNTINDLANATNRMLQNHGYPQHPVDACKYFVGDGARKLVERALPNDQRNADILDDCLAEMKNEYARCWADQTHLYDGVAAMLTRLEERGIPMAILSNKPDPATKMIVGHFLGKWKFVEIRGAVDHIPRKPAPDASAIISKTAGIAPEHFIHVGDTSIDMHTAKAVGMQSVGVTWGFRLRDELEEARADWIIDHPDELL